MSDLSILFPTDAAPAKAPDWYQAQRHEAEARLSGSQARDKGSDAAAIMFGEKPDAVPDAKASDDPAGKLFKNDSGYFDDSVVTSFFDGFAGSAVADGDIERAQELNAAKDAMISDFKTAGTDPTDLREAFDIVRERQADTLFGEVSAERLAVDQAQAMAVLTDEGVTDLDLNAARAFIRDLEIISPGTMRSLEATGAGNDPRLIRKVIAEAKRRGYGR